MQKILASVSSVFILSESHTAICQILCQMVQKNHLFFSSLFLLLSTEEIKVKNLTKKSFINRSTWIQKIPVIASPRSNLLDYDKSSPLGSWYCKDTTTCCKTENIIKNLYQECSVAFRQAWPARITPFGLGTICSSNPFAFYLA